MQQSYRNQQVRGIAKELAGLEPGATEASKLRLAMQFEDAVFKTGSSLADYHKKLTKRLNKLKKNYKPPVVQGENQTEKEQKIKDLFGKHGATLQYIVKHAAEAVKEMRVKSGEDKAKRLQQHLDNAKKWAKSLGVLSGKPNLQLSSDELGDLTRRIEEGLDIIRSHTVKLAEPDAFLLESIKKVEEEFRDKPEAVKVQSQSMRQKYDKIRSVVGIRDFESVTKSLDATTKPVPLSLPPKEAALAHLAKMHAASHVLLGYLLAEDKYSVPKQAVVRAHEVASKTSMEATQEFMKQLRAKEKSTAGSLQLRDVWMKRLVLPPETPLKPALRSKALLKPGRNAPTTVVSALKGKDAELVRPEPTGAGAHVIVPFGGVFTMTIFFVPLLVTFRAGDKPIQSNASSCASWTPLHHGGVDWIVQERLRDASAEATLALRRYFQKASNASSEFEVEVMETSSLLEFIELTKQTFL